MQAELNENKEGYPRDKCIHQLFEAQVERTPDFVAVTFPPTGSEHGDDKQLTYRELNRKANQLAHHLRRLGVGPEVLVGICMERSLTMVVALLGILKAGGAYVPLDPGYPKERLAFMLEDSGAAVLVTQQRLLNGLQSSALNSQPSFSPFPKVMCLDTDWETIGRESEDTPLRTSTPDNLAYVIYTSGSTGEPKGVQIPHRALVNFLESMRRKPGLTSQDTVLAVTTLSFDIAGLEIFLPLVAGGRVVATSREAASDGALLSEKLTQSGATVMQATPATWRLLVESGWRGDKRLKILCGGEALSRELADQLLGRCRSLWNMYGPTETTVWSAVCRVEAGEGVVSIGRPIANTQIYILDSNLQPVPVGVPGELYIGGDGLARGYLNRPELTAEKFVPNPFSSVLSEAEGDESSARLYRTGDQARYLPDGNIEFLGRMDHQVKIRGFRIEPGEIEAVLDQHPAARQSIVVAREDEPGERRLVAYLVPKQQGSPSVTELRDYLKERLPDYMVPSAFVTLEAMPLTPNGKIDRRALPPPGSTRPQLKRIFAVPRTELERVVAAMWQDVLGLEKIGINDDFFELGGDSLKGARFINRLQAELGEYVYIVALFDASTIADLARYLCRHYRDAVERNFGTASFHAVGPRADETVSNRRQRVDAQMVKQMRQLIPPLPRREMHDDRKNPRTIFILSPPRSGSTLLRVMLAGHPRLFAPQELDLLSSNTLEERQAARLRGGNIGFLEGTIRAIMEIKSCDAELAKKIMEGYERQKLTTMQFYRVMQEWIGEKILVDKSTSYALDQAILERAEMYFEDPLYIHLLRHPYGMIHSFEEVRLDQVFFRDQNLFTTRELAELIWLICHQNILRFLQRVPGSRQHRVIFEDLVYEPRAVMERICRFLGLGFHPDMLEPYKDKEKRMTDGLHAESRMVGDMKFYEHTAVDTSVADRWESHYPNDFLGDITWDLAESLGYSKGQKRLSPARPATTNGPASKPEAAEQLNHILEEVESLSDEEAVRLLAEETRQRKVG